MQRNYIGGGVIAIDSIYKTYTPTSHLSNISFSPDISLLQTHFDMFFVSDVLHHLTQDFWEELLEKITDTPYIVIKDIDASHKFGNFANRLHDLIINGELVRDIYPAQLSQKLENLGYEIKYFYLPKLWYPHFLLIAVKI